MIIRLATALAATSALLGACNGPAANVERQLVVEGPSENVARFVTNQIGETQTSSGTVAPLPLGRARATMVMTNRFDNDDLVTATDQALAYGLSYSVIDVRTT